MGSAAYNRGSRVISEQIRRDLEASRRVSIDRSKLEGIEDEVLRLRGENARLRRERDRAVLRLRERRATLTAERRDREEERARLLSRARSAERAFLAFRRRWEWVSRLLRRAASPEAVRDAWAELTSESGVSVSEVSR